MRTELRDVAVEELDATSFSPHSVKRLPEPARRWLRHSAAAGTPNYTQVELELEGHIKLGSWRRFTARHTIRPGHGYSWNGNTHIAGVRVNGMEAMNPATARKVWQAAGLLPVFRSAGPEVLNSAAGRLAVDSVFVPTAFDRATWDVTADPNATFATWRIGCRVDRVRLDVAPNGRLQSVWNRRWGTPPRERYGRHPFGLKFEEEITFAGVTIPRTFSAHWGWDSDERDEGAVLRAQVTDARFS